MFCKHTRLYSGDKTHTQDNGKITYYSYCDVDKPTNVHLVGDVRQRGKLPLNLEYLIILISMPLLAQVMHF